MSNIDVRGVGRQKASDKEVTLYFDRPLTDNEMLSLREKISRLLNK